MGDRNPPIRVEFAPSLMFNQPSPLPRPTQPGHPSRYDHRWERNGVTAGPVTKTAGILTKSVKGAGC